MKITNIAFATNKINAIVRYSESMINERANELVKLMEDIRNLLSDESTEKQGQDLLAFLVHTLHLTDSMLATGLVSKYIDTLKESVKTPLEPEQRLTALEIALASIMPEIEIVDWSLHANFEYMHNVLHYQLELPEESLFWLHSVMDRETPDIDRGSFENLFVSLGNTLKGEGSFRPFSHKQPLYCYTWFILEELHKGGTYFETLRNQWATHIYNIKTVIETNEGFEAIMALLKEHGITAHDLAEMVFLRLCNEEIMDVLYGTGSLFNQDGSVFETIDQYYKDIEAKARARRADKQIKEMSHDDFIESWKKKMRMSGMPEDQIESLASQMKM